MRTIIYSLLFVACYLPLTANAQQITKEQLIGTWVFDYDASIAKMENKIKSKYDSMPKEALSKIKSSYQNRKMYFNNEGSFVLVFSDGRRTECTWSLNKNTKNIEITDPKDNVHYWKIKKMTSATMIIKPKGLREISMVIPEMHFTKI